MMERAEMIERVRAVADAEFQSEVRHYLGIEDREYAYDEVTALFDIEDRSELAAEEEEDADVRKEARRLLRVARGVLIDIGFYRVMSLDEVENTITTGRRAPWNFKANGVAYVSDEAADEWKYPEDDNEDEDE